MVYYSYANKLTAALPEKTHVFFVGNSEVADLSPIHFRKQSATDGTKLDLNIGGFHQGLAA